MRGSFAAVLCLVLVGFAAPARADTVINFDDLGAVIATDYGSTSQVNVAYGQSSTGPLTVNLGENYLYLEDGPYSGLTKVATAGKNKWGVVFLTPTQDPNPGASYAITLKSFDLGANTDAANQNIRIYSGSELKYGGGPQQISGTTPTNWSGLVTATEPIGISIWFGPSSWTDNTLNYEVGIDNITFDIQEVPAAVPLPLAGWGGLGLMGIVGWIRRRRNGRGGVMESLKANDTSSQTMSSPGSSSSHASVLPGAGLV